VGRSQDVHQGCSDGFAAGETDRRSREPGGEVVAEHPLVDAHQRGVVGGAGHKRGFHLGGQGVEEVTDTTADEADAPRAAALEGGHLRGPERDDGAGPVGGAPVHRDEDPLLGGELLGLADLRLQPCGVEARHRLGDRIPRPGFAVRPPGAQCPELLVAVRDPFGFALRVRPAEDVLDVIGGQLRGHTDRTYDGRDDVSHPSWFGTGVVRQGGEVPGGQGAVGSEFQLPVELQIPVERWDGAVPGVGVFHQPLQQHQDVTCPVMPVRGTWRTP